MLYDTSAGFGVAKNLLFNHLTKTLITTLNMNDQEAFNQVHTNSTYICIPNDITGEHTIGIKTKVIIEE